MYDDSIAWTRGIRAFLAMRNTAQLCQPSPLYCSHNMLTNKSSSKFVKAISQHHNVVKHHSERSFLHDRSFSAHVEWTAISSTCRILICFTSSSKRQPHSHTVTSSKPQLFSPLITSTSPLSSLNRLMSRKVAKLSSLLTSKLTAPRSTTTPRLSNQEPHPHKHTHLPKPSRSLGSDLPNLIRCIRDHAVVVQSSRLPC